MPKHQQLNQACHLILAEVGFPLINPRGKWSLTRNIWFDLCWIHLLSPQLVEPQCSAKYTWDINKVIIIVVIIIIIIVIIIIITRRQAWENGEPSLPVQLVGYFPRVVW